MKILVLVVSAVLTMTSFFVSSSTQNDVADQIKQSIAAAGKAVKVPNSKSIVVFEHSGQAVLISDNPRYVVKGQLFDMWNNEQVENSGQLNASSKIIPLGKLPIDYSQIFKLTTYPKADKTLTVFINPFDEQASNQIEIISKYASSYQIDWIFMSTQGTKVEVEQLLRLACVVLNEQPGDVIKMFIQNNISIPNQFCQKESVVKTFAFARFLNIHTLPTLIASNDVVSQGMPNSFISWLANNME